jgi:uncharacterized DUF497 family protein
MAELFEWDQDKARRNLLKHGVSFEEARSVFFDPSSKTIDDPEHSVTEDRFIINGISIFEQHLVVAHTFRGGKIRIISARRANKRERNQYEQKAK